MKTSLRTVVLGMALGVVGALGSGCNSNAVPLEQAPAYTPPPPKPIEESNTPNQGPGKNSSGAMNRDPGAST